MSYRELFPIPGILNEEDLSLAGNLQKWADDEVMGKRLELGEDFERLLKPAMEKLFVDIGMQQLLWPEECGGVGQNTPEVAMTLATALEEVGRADAGIGFLYASTFALCSTFTMKHCIKEKLVSKLASFFCGEKDMTLGSLVMPLLAVEEKAGDPCFRGRRLQAKAVKKGDEWEIYGEGIRPLNSGADASFFGVLCALEDDEKPAFFIIPGDIKGIERGEMLLKTGLAASRNTDVNFNGVEVGAENLVFHGQEPFREMLSWLYLGVSSTTVGALFASYEILKDWGDVRVIKGRGNLFKENPLTGAIMVEVAKGIMTCQALTYHLAGMLSAPDHYGAACEERVFVSALNVATEVTKIAEQSINYILELMGSAGYAREWNLERYWRDVKTLQVHLGSRELNAIEMAHYFYGSKSL